MFTVNINWADRELFLSAQLKHYCHIATEGNLMDSILVYIEAMIEICQFFSIYIKETIGSALNYYQKDD